MKVLYNKLLPFKGFAAINMFGVILARKEHRQLSPVMLNHEAIHTAQMRELLYAGFYLLYTGEWLGRLLMRLWTKKNAYRNISFEREAYSNAGNMDYLKTRRPFAQWRSK